MKGKNLMIYGLGAASGFIGGSVFVLSKVLESERMRQASVDILADKIGEALFGERRRCPRRNSRVSYRSYSEERRYTDLRYRPVDRCIFKTYKDAEKVLDEMNKVAMEYGMVRVIDYYDLCLWEDHCSHVEDNYYGWLQSDIADADIIRYCKGYMIDLPKAIRLK